MSTPGSERSGGRRPPPPPGAGVDQLIERGLERYGAGDVDGALLAWEQALGLDPQDVRAVAYVDYVRENYEMLHGTSSLPDVDVPFGLGAVEGDDAYEVEVSQDTLSKVERYVESIDEGWFLDDEPRSARPVDHGPAAPLPPGPLSAPRPVVAVSFHSVADELDFGPAPLETPPPAPQPIELSEPPVRPSRLQLPLSAAYEGQSDAEITLEMEADEPELDPPAGGGGASASDEEQTKDFVAGAWPPPPEADLDFTDQRSMVPTREIPLTAGFVRVKPSEGTSPLLAPTVSASVVPMVARGPKPLTTPPVIVIPDPADDDLATRPGNASTVDPLDNLEIGAPRLSADALAEFGGHGTGTGRAGPNDKTKETPPVRVRLPVEQTGESDLEPGDEERTTERSTMTGRPDTSSETTIERGANHFSPAPIDEGHEASGRHPPLVIIEDPVMGTAPAQSRVPTDELAEGVATSRVPTDELSAGTARLKRATATVPPPARSPASSLPTGPGHESIAKQLEDAIEATALPDENRADRTRRRVTELIERAVAASTGGDHPTAIVALDIALAEDPESAVAQKLLHRHQPAILDCYQRFVGSLGARPALAMPMHELADQKLDIRAAFLLSRIDGTLSFEEILDVSGMQRSEAFRHLSILLLRGILEVR